MRLLNKALAKLWAFLKWGRLSGVNDNFPPQKLVYSEKSLDTPGWFTGNKPWGEGKTWREAFKDAKRWDKWK